jgi:hypothetical protein
MRDVRDFRFLPHLLPMRPLREKQRLAEPACQDHAMGPIKLSALRGMIFSTQ